MRPATSRQPECLVLGGGLAGAMAGLRLAAAERKTILLEKEKTAHHKVCGEFLSPEAVGYLRQAGVEPTKFGAVPIDILRLSVGRRMVETKLPFTALSLSRYLLDEALLSRASEEGCEILRGVVADGLERSGQDWTTHLSTGESISASAAFLATGKYDLRGWPRPAGIQTDLVGFKIHWRLPRAQTATLENAMELFLFPGGYGGLALVENEVANLCFVVRKSQLRRLGGWPPMLQALRSGNRRLRQLLHQAQPLWDRPLAVSSIPYGHLGSPFDLPALWPIGDQVAVIPSFTGDGMSIALHSAAVAAAGYCAGSSPAHYQAQLISQLNRGMKLATLLSRACVRSLPRISAPLALSVFPHAMSWIAAATRIPPQAIDCRAL